MDVIAALNGLAVGIFGMVLSAAFCDIYWTKRKQFLMAGSMCGLLLIQGLLFYRFDTTVVQYLYPVITHLPIIGFLWFFSKRKFWPVIAVLTAYLCCQLRRWLALLIVALFFDGAEMQNIIEMIITLPLLFAILKIIAPAVCSLAHSDSWVQYQFGMIPVIYYVFDYTTKIYTDWQLKGAPVVTEFMSFVCSLAYLIFVMYFSREKFKRSQLEQIQESLNLQVAQSVREIENLRHSQQKTREHRHDLRHHMQYLSSCIENEKFEQAQIYIRKICSEIESNQVIAFCENEAANLILSAFAGRAKEKEICMRIKVRIPKEIHVSESDFCVLLSNALENALHACEKNKKTDMQSMIEVCAFVNKNKLFLEIKNTCEEEVTFVEGVPASNRPGHGIGVKNICALVDRYGGGYEFSLAANQFVLRIFI